MKNKLSPHEIENAIIASMFSDSVKFPKVPGENGKFRVHNIDGARAAAEVLPRYFDLSAPHNMERLEHIYRAIREHQISPPEFMASITKMSLTGALGSVPPVYADAGFHSQGMSLRATQPGACGNIRFL